MKSEFIVRQGDVLLIKIDNLPNGEIAKRVGDNHILAYGEASGHAHAIKANECELYHANDSILECAKKYGVKDVRAVTHGLRIVVDNGHLFHGTPTSGKGVKERPEALLKEHGYTTWRKNDPIDPDHPAINLPCGDYLVIRPREYSDEEEFKVIAD